MKYVIGIDLGTSSIKTLLLDATGRTIASAMQEYPMAQPHNGWAEQDPADWWKATIATLREVTSAMPHKNDIVGLGISGQMHGLVMLDKDGEVLRPSIIWCDQRTQAECEDITRAVGAERLIEITANPALPGFTASKILWVKKHEPHLYERCRHILLPKDYLRFKLTGQFATEVSDASGMQLLDIRERRWSDEVLQKLDIDHALLAQVYESPDVTGVISRQASELTGLSENTVVVGGAGDNAAAAVGTGVVHDGVAFTTIGSSGVVYAHTSQVSVDPKGRVHTFCCAVPNAWHVMGVTQGAGLSLRWFRNQFCHEEVLAANQEGISAYQLMDQAAAHIRIGADRLVFLPYLMGERTPYLDSDCRGVFFGLSAMHTRAHLIRAVMEGVTFSLNDCLSVLKELRIAPETMLATGGGCNSPLWRQMMADVYDCPVATVSSKEGAALGAGILAAVGAGLYPSVEEACDVIVEKEPALIPNKTHSEQYRKAYGIYRALYPALKDHFIGLQVI